MRTALGFLVIAAASATAAGQTTRPAASRPKPPSSVLRIARSKDGLAFDDAGEMLLADASAPALVCLPNGHLLAMFDQAVGSSGGATVMAVSRSSDEGRTWSRPRAIRFAPAMARELKARHGSLVMTSDRVARLYFVASEAKGAKSDGSAVLSAVSGNGLEYRLDDTVRIPLAGGSDASVTTVRVRSRVDVYVDALGEAGAKADSGQAAERFTSTDGRRFRAAGAVRVPGLRFVGSVVPNGRGLRAYMSGGDGVQSAVSGDGVEWRPEAGVRLAGGWDPAVVQLRDGTFLMMYCAAADARSRSAPQLALASGGASEGSPSQNSTPPYEGGEVRGDVGGWESFGPGGEALGADGESAAASGGLNGMAPTPDLQNKVDYVSWIEQAVGLPSDQNASSSYGTLGDDYAQSSDALRSVYDGWTALGPPGPWSPADHPDWEASYQVSEGLVAQFRAGSQDSRPYATPLIWPADTAPEERLLVSTLLPSCAVFRGMTKAVLAQAWRTESGVVPPEQMRDALQTCYGNVSHVQQGMTLIERLVAAAERSLVEENARWALQRDVFSSPDELEATLRMLRERDVPAADPAGWMRTEHARALDTIQYLFAPDSPDQEPKLRMDRLEKIAGMTGTQGLEHFRAMTPEDGRAAIEMVNSYFEQSAEAWKGGYLAVKAANPDRLAEQWYEQNALVGLTLPSMDRASVLIARSEASRRATQLSYAVQLFKAHNGRWPASLDELPTEYDDTVKTDPFTGGRFGYRVSEGGPTIYTAGENGRDDGGVHSKTWGRGKQDESDDYVFWPPQAPK